ncbi:glycoside hydrolase family 18 protein [Streptomyces sp. NPDC000931]
MDRTEPQEPATTADAPPPQPAPDAAPEPAEGGAPSPEPPDVSAPDDAGDGASRRGAAEGGSPSGVPSHAESAAVRGEASSSGPVGAGDAASPPESAGGDCAAVPGGRAGGRRGPWGRRVRRTVLAVVLLLLVPLLAVETALRVNYMGDPADGTYTRDRDAMWLGHAWVDGRKKDADVTALARRLKDTGIRDLYVHSGPLEHDGTLPKSAYPRARWFIDAVHRELPGVRVQAFLGDVLANGGPDGLELGRAGTRAEVVRSARQVLDTGYDGVHLDLEPLHSGDRDYLSLLDDLRAVTRDRDAQLSVAAHQIDPLPHLHSVAGLFADHPKWWSQKFFGQVARRVDQIAVMSYDTARPLESTYGGYVAQQTSLALEVTPPTTHLLMGLPFYYESNPSHWGHAETVAAAVRGARLGLSRTDPDRELFGVAPYIDFAATETNWKEYREGWLRPGAS